MSFGSFESVSFKTHQAIPLKGEIILLRYPVSEIPFVYGPAPSALAISAYQSGAVSEITAASLEDRVELRRVLILGVAHDRGSRLIDLEFMPIMAYTSCPHWYRDEVAWDADHWMTHVATDVERLHHLPVPATGWSPASALELSFGGWVNSRKAWVAMVPVTHEIPETHKVPPPWAVWGVHD